MTRYLALSGFVILGFGGCTSSAVDSSEMMLEQLSGSWKLTAVFENGRQTTDTLSVVTLFGRNGKRTHTILSDSGIHRHIYTARSTYFREVLKPYIIEFIIEPDYNASVNYFLRPTGLTNEQKFAIWPSEFIFKPDDGLLLHYRWRDYSVAKISSQHLVLLQDAKEWHYEKYGRGFYKDHPFPVPHNLP